MVTYSFERLSVDNLKHLQTLYMAVFKKPISLEFLQRKYDTTFAGVSFIGYLATTQDHSPIAFYGVLPCHFRLGNRTILAAQSADTMTHPDYRRSGLFLTLAEKTFTLAGQNGIEFIFGFPNQNSLPGFMKLKWHFLPSPMKRLMIKANPIPFFNIITKIPSLRHAYNHLLMYLYQGQKHSVDFQRMSPDGVVRDDAFLDYKTYSDNLIIRIENVVAWVKPEVIFKVGYADLEGSPSINAFLKTIRNIAYRSGCRHVMFITSENTSLYKALIPHITPHDSFPIGFLPLSDKEYDLSKAEFHYCDIDIF